MSSSSPTYRGLGRGGLPSRESSLRARLAWSAPLRMLRLLRLVQFWPRETALLGREQVASLLCRLLKMLCRVVISFRFSI
jgi:hypothetical protein